MRIHLLEKKEAKWYLRPFYALLKRQFGKELTPYKVWAYRPGPLLWFSGLTLGIQSSKVLDHRIKSLVSLRAAQIIGCPF